MNSYMRNVLPVYVFILTVAVSMLLPSLNENAGAQPPCFARICKVAPELPPESGVFFPFTFQAGGEQVGVPG